MAGNQLGRAVKEENSSDRLRNSRNDRSRRRDDVKEHSVQRRGNAEQGRALEMLGHAIEYLVDSRMFFSDQPSVRAEQEAVQILMRQSRAVFLECPAVMPIRIRVGRWVAGRLRKIVDRDPDTQDE